MRTFAFACLAALLCSGAAFADGPVTLRDPIEARGPAITLGDVFENAGPASARAVALAPAPGRSATFSTRFLAAAAAAAGLDWTPPGGLQRITVSRPAAALTSVAPRAQAPDATTPSVRRGEVITLVYAAPGLQLLARARALEDGAVGQSIRVVNLQSNRQIDVVVTGSGAAAATGMR